MTELMSDDPAQYERFLQKVDHLMAALEKHRDAMAQQRHARHAVSLLDDRGGVLHNKSISLYVFHNRSFEN